VLPSCFQLCHADCTGPRLVSSSSNGAFDSDNYTSNDGFEALVAKGSVGLSGVVPAAEAEEVLPEKLTKSQRASLKRKRKKEIAINRAASELATTSLQLKQLEEEYRLARVSGVQFSIGFTMEPTKEQLDVVDSIYAGTTAFNDARGNHLHWRANTEGDVASVTGKSSTHSKAGLFLLRRNGQSIGAASAVVIESHGLIIIENFAVRDEHQGRGIATIFNEEMLRVLRANKPPTVHTVMTVPAHSNVHAVIKAGFEESKKTHEYLAALSLVTGLAYDSYDDDAKAFTIGAVYTAVLSEEGVVWL